jgi:hypothetical protein
MSGFAFKTIFNMAGQVSALDLSAVAVVHTTKDALAAHLGSMALLRNKPAHLVFSVDLNQATAAGAASVKLVAAGVTVASVPLNLTTGTEFSGRVLVDLANVQGQTPIKAELEVTTAADAATTADFDARLEVEAPFVSMGC